MSRKRASASRPTHSEARPAKTSPPMDRDRIWAMALVLLFLFFAWRLANTTPLVTEGSLINAPDEAAHVGYVRAIAVGRRLPTRSDPDFPTYQWHQPPLYYAAASLGYTLGTLGMRAVSVLFGLISLWAIWSAARTLAPRRPELSLMAVAFAALLPMRQAVMSAVGNDAAIECIFSLAMMVTATLAVRGVTPLRALALAVLLGLGILTKLSGLLLLPGAALALFMASPRASLRSRVVRAVWPVALAVVIASPWLVLNVRRYGQVMPIRAFHEEFARTSRASDWIGRQELAVDHVTGDLKPGPLMGRSDYAALVADWSVRTFFGAYTTPARAAIGAPSFLPPSFYAVWVALLLVGLAGMARAAVSGSLKRTAAWVFTLPAVVTILLVVLSFAGFTATYFQAQGRYLYPCMLPLAIGWANGYTALMPDRYRAIIAVLTIAVMAALAAAFGLIYVAPTYAGR